ncbi:MAG: hypothetical protein P4M11_09110 [Candidatus Pacebacteria bacterium]|nr:hypothetical protein [Candidatus Paceibacterota bacterium]
MQLGIEQTKLAEHSKYAESVGSAVVEGEMSHETMNYLLKNQLIDASIINHNLKRVISLLTWKLHVERTTAGIRSETARVLQKTVNSLESLLSRSGIKHQAIRKRIEKLGYELDQLRDQISSQCIRYHT